MNSIYKFNIVFHFSVLKKIFETVNTRFELKNIYIQSIIFIKYTNINIYNNNINLFSYFMLKNSKWKYII